MNDELRNRSIELNSSNVFLEAVFTSLQSGVAVLDRDLYVQVWNTRAVDMWGLRAEEVHGLSFFALDIGLPVGDLHQPIRDVLSGVTKQRDVTVSAVNRKGKTVSCKTGITPLLERDGRITGVIVRMDEDADVAA